VDEISQQIEHQAKAYRSHCQVCSARTSTQHQNVSGGSVSTTAAQWQRPHSWHRNLKFLSIRSASRGRSGDGRPVRGRRTAGKNRTRIGPATQAASAQCTAIGCRPVYCDLLWAIKQGGSPGAVEGGSDTHPSGAVAGRAFAGQSAGLGLRCGLAPCRPPR